LLSAGGVKEKEEEEKEEEEKEEDKEYKHDLPHADTMQQTL